MSEKTYISHFVVIYNHTTGIYEIDESTADARFEDGVIYDINSAEWINHNELPSNDPLVIMDENAQENLADALNYINGKSKIVYRKQEG